MDDYFSLAQSIRIITPILMSSVAFYLLHFVSVQQGRLGPPVFYIRIGSATLFFLAALAGTPFSTSVQYMTIDIFQYPLLMLLTVVLGAVAIVVAKRNSSNPAVLKNYPQLKVTDGPQSLMVANVVTWAIYLFGYELFFRGYLLFSALDAMSMSMAVALNVGLYFLAHIFKGWRESLSSIPFGILLCVLTISTGNFWSAFIIHSCLALSTEWFTLKHLQKKNLNASLTQQ